MIPGNDDRDFWMVHPHHADKRRRGHRERDWRESIVKMVNVHCLRLDFSDGLEGFRLDAAIPLEGDAQDIHMLRIGLVRVKGETSKVEHFFPFVFDVPGETTSERVFQVVPCIVPEMPQTFHRHIFSEFH